MVKTGFWIWAMSDFQRMPSQDEVAQYDPRWISDMKLMMQLYSFQTNSTSVMKVFEEQLAKEEAIRIRQSSKRNNAPS